MFTNTNQIHKYNKSNDSNSNTLLEQSVANKFKNKQIKIDSPGYSVKHLGAEGGGNSSRWS
jgi:hypothetical protein